MRILLAIDPSPSSEATVSEILARPWPEQAEFCVLNVVDLLIPMVGFPALGTLRETALRKSEALVNSVADKLIFRSFEVRTEVIEGYPPSCIVDYARDWTADLVIVGSHGLSRVERFLLGSTAQIVVRQAPCSVEIVRPGPRVSKPEGGAMQILLATDGSDFSLDAARSIVARPWPEASEIKVITVVDIPDPVIEPWKGTPEDVARIESAVLRQAEGDITAARAILADSELNVTACVLKGYPKSVIVEEAEQWGADLLFVGSHGRRGLSRLFMGSVSEAVAAHAHCSVEVVRARARFDDDRR